MKHSTIHLSLLLVAATCIGSSALAQSGATAAQPPGQLFSSSTSVQELHSVDLNPRFPAELAESTLKKLFPTTVFSSDTVSNTLYFRCNEKQRAEIEAFVERADRKAQKAELEKEAIFQDRQNRQLAQAMSEQAAMRELRDVRILQTKHVAAIELHRVVQELGMLQNVNVSATGDSLVLSGSEPAELDRIAELAMKLDVPPKSATLFGGGRLPQSPAVRATESRLGALPRRARNSTNNPLLPAASGTLEDEEKAFRAKQSYLRKQIELQRQKLEMLERRLEERELAAKKYFSAAKANRNPKKTPPANSQFGLLGETEIQVNPELGTIIMRGKKDDVETVTELIEEITEQASKNATVITESPEKVVEEMLPPESR
ncbi:MAG: hypothetical protein AAFU85_18595 [Planctomycetota bacterium]